MRPQNHLEEAKANHTYNREFGKPDYEPVEYVHQEYPKAIKVRAYDPQKDEFTERDIIVNSAEEEANLLPNEASAPSPEVPADAQE